MHIQIPVAKMNARMDIYPQCLIIFLDVPVWVLHLPQQSVQSAQRILRLKRLPVIRIFFPADLPLGERDRAAMARRSFHRMDGDGGGN